MKSCAHHGGEWSQSTDGPFAGHYTLSVKTTQTAPAGKIYKRIVDGEGDNVSFYYRVMVQPTE